MNAILGHIPVPASPPEPQTIWTSDPARETALLALLLLCAGAVTGALTLAPVLHTPSLAYPVQGEQTATAPEGEEAPPREPVATPARNTSPQRTANVERTWVQVGGVGVNAIAVNPQGRNVRLLPGFAAGTDLSANRFRFEGFGAMVRRYRPRAAVNGTYFHLRTAEPTGSIVADGQLVHRGGYGAAFYVLRDGQAAIDFTARAGRPYHWPKEVVTGLRSGPSLVRDYAIAVMYGREEGYRDPHVFGTARRSALGVTASGKVLLVTVQTPVTLNKLAHIMLRLGAKDAVNLDGGSSSALYSNGQFVTIPRRRLSHIMMVYD